MTIQPVLPGTIIRLKLITGQGVKSNKTGTNIPENMRRLLTSAVILCYYKNPPQRFAFCVKKVSKEILKKLLTKQKVHDIISELPQKSSSKWQTLTKAVYSTVNGELYREQ